jgi:hypothetical protein
MLASSPARHMHIIVDMHAESMAYPEVNRYISMSTKNIKLGGTQGGTIELLYHYTKE